MERVKKANRIWAMYKGDTFIASGTFKEIAEMTGKRVDHLYHLTTPAYKKQKDYGNKMQMYEIDDDEE